MHLFIVLYISGSVMGIMGPIDSVNKVTPEVCASVARDAQTYVRENTLQKDAIVMCIQANSADEIKNAKPNSNG